MSQATENTDRSAKKISRQKRKNFTRYYKTNPVMITDGENRIMEALQSHTQVEKGLLNDIKSLTQQVKQIKVNNKMPMGKPSPKYIDNRKLIKSQLSQQTTANACDTWMRESCDGPMPNWTHSLFSSNLPCISTSPLDSVSFINASKAVITSSSVSQYCIFADPDNVFEGVEVWGFSSTNSEWGLFDLVPCNANVGAIAPLAACGIYNIFCNANTVSATNQSLTGAIRGGLIQNIVHPCMIEGGIGAEQKYLIPPHITPLSQLSEGTSVVGGACFQRPPSLELINNLVFPNSAGLQEQYGSIVDSVAPMTIPSSGVIFASDRTDVLYGLQRLTVQVELVVLSNSDVAPTDLEFQIIVPYSNVGGGVLNWSTKTSTLNGIVGMSTAETQTFNLSLNLDLTSEPYASRTCFFNGTSGSTQGVLVKIANYNTSPYNGHLEVLQCGITFSSPAFLRSEIYKPALFVQNVNSDVNMNVVMNATYAFALATVDSLKFSTPKSAISWNKAAEAIRDYIDCGGKLAHSGQVSNSFSFSQFLDGVRQAVETGAKIAPHVMGLLNSVGSSTTPSIVPGYSSGGVSNLLLSRRR